MGADDGDETAPSTDSDYLLDEAAPPWSMFEKIAAIGLVLLTLRFIIAITSGIMYITSTTTPYETDQEHASTVLGFFCVGGDTTGLFLIGVVTALVAWRVSIAASGASGVAGRDSASEVREFTWRLVRWNYLCRWIVVLFGLGGVSAAGLVVDSSIYPGSNNGWTQPIQVIDSGGLSLVYVCFWICGAVLAVSLYRFCDRLFLHFDDGEPESLDTPVNA